MNKLFLLLFITIFFSFSAQANEWKSKNKWKISCGVVDKESLTVNGKVKKYSKKAFSWVNFLGAKFWGLVHQFSEEESTQKNLRVNFSGAGQCIRGRFRRLNFQPCH